jgi:hypothetical protein
MPFPSSLAHPDFELTDLFSWVCRMLSRSVRSTAIGEISEEGGSICPGLLKDCPQECVSVIEGHNLRMSTATATSTF